MGPCTDQNVGHGRKSYIWRKWPDAPQKGQTGSHTPPTLHTDMKQRHCKCTGHVISLNLQQKKMKKIQDQDLGHTKDLVSQHPPDSSEHLDQDDSKILLSNTVQAH